jgi:hypothetical protein
MTFVFLLFFLIKLVYPVDLERAEALLRFLISVSVEKKIFIEEIVCRFEDTGFVESLRERQKYVLPVYPNPTDAVVLEEVIERSKKSMRAKKNNSKKLIDEYCAEYREISKNAEGYSNPKGAQGQFHALLSVFDIEPWVDKLSSNVN